MLVVVLGLSFSIGVEEIVVRVTDWPPQYYQDKYGKWQGVDVELTRQLIKTAGYKPRFVNMPWSRGVNELRAGSVQMIACFDINEDRKDFAMWIGPERNVIYSLVVQKGLKDLDIKSLDDLIKASRKHKKRFGHQRDVFFSQEFNRRLDEDEEFMESFEFVSSVEQNIQKTRFGRILGFFEEKLAIEYKIKTAPEFADIVVHDFVLASRPTYWGVSKNGISAEQLDRLKQAYKKCTEDGSFDIIRKKWGVL